MGNGRIGLIIVHRRAAVVQQKIAVQDFLGIFTDLSDFLVDMLAWRNVNSLVWERAFALNAVEQALKPP
jgi:hypothetical protein